MRSTSEVSGEAAAIIGDAVAVLTSRAVEPALEPFRALLTDLIEKLEARCDDLDEVVASDRADRQKLRSQLGERIEALAKVGNAGNDQVREIATTVGELRAALAQSTESIQQQINDLSRRVRRIRTLTVFCLLLSVGILAVLLTTH